MADASGNLGIVRPWLVVLLAGIGALVPPAGPAAAQAVPSAREAAVLEARAGDREAGIAALRRQLEAGSPDPLVAADLATLLQQEGRPAEALAVARRAPAPLPDYALLAATRAARDLRRWAEAERLAREGEHRFPEQSVWPVLRALIQADAGRPQQALATLRTPRAQAAGPEEIARAEAFARQRLAAERAAARDAAREAAVRLAREGRHAEAIAALRRLLAESPDDRSARADLLTILADQGRHAEAVALIPQRPGTLPAYAQAAAVRALRGEGDLARAEALARDGMRRFADDPDFPALAALVLTDAGRAQEALALLRGAAGRRATPVERLLAEGYALETLGDGFAALGAYGRALRLEPASRAARDAAAGLLRRMDAPWGAAGLVDAPPPALQEGTARLPLAAQQAGAMVRWGSQAAPEEPERRFEGTDAALERLDALRTAGPPPDLLRRIRLDRVVALRDRVRMAEALAEADALALEGDLPPYVREARADALLYLRRPAEALAEYRAVLAADRFNENARNGAFYAAVEAERFTEAYALADAALAEQPRFRHFADDPTRYPNPDWTGPALAAGLARLYGDQPGAAWARLRPLADGAPANQDIRLGAAAVMRARGWSRAAGAETEIAASLSPDRLAARLAMAELALARYRYAAADREVAALHAIWPENLAVQRLAREADAQRRFVLEFEAKPGDSTGGGANASGRTVESAVRLHSPPVADNWRLFALAGVATANPPEGFAQRNRAGGGVEYRAPFLRATAFATQSWGTLNRAGGGGTLDWTATDRLRLSLAAETFTSATPLRALLFGITADEVAGRATWRWHESSSISGVLGWYPFTDGNRRLAAGMELRQKLLDRPHFDLTGRADLYTSSNTRADAPYFNPRRDVAATAGLLAEHVTWRRYDTSFVQALAVDAGSYSQRGHGTGWIGTLGYEHRWRFDPLTEFRYGVQLTRRVYDGDPARGIAFLFGLTQRI